MTPGMVKGNVSSVLIVKVYTSWLFYVDMGLSNLIEGIAFSLSL